MNDTPALSFGTVATAYESGRPDYPVDAVRWALGSEPLDVLELGAGTGKLTRALLDQGHRVLATDPLPEMLAVLTEKVDTPAALARAEQLPLPSRSVDVVVCGQSFHWFRAAEALKEITRVLRPGGQLVLIWNFRDLRIPWVRKLSDLIGVESREGLLDSVIDCLTLIDLEEAQFKTWQTHTAQTLGDLVRSRSAAATLSEPERESLVAEVTDLYNSYGRGHDGMQMPYTTHVHKATVNHLVAPQPPKPPPGPATPTESAATVQEPPTKSPRQSVPLPPEDPGVVLIDFR